jgi:2-desacetyl-2-hydroxyethyl bacteriochlorophyllide A dehydrogenase
MKKRLDTQAINKYKPLPKKTRGELKMKAARFYRVDNPLTIEEIPTPTPGSGEVLVRVKASGICGSDLYTYHFYSPKSFGLRSLTLGHECAGVVEAVGNNVKVLSEGDRVCMDYVISCGHCYYCITGRSNLCENLKCAGFEVDGAFAEYTCLSERQFLKLPENIPFAQGAILGCAVVTPYHSLRIAEITPGDTVAIYGVGGVGMHAVNLAARVFGAGKTIAVDITEYKLKLATKLGADETINAAEEDPVETIKKLTGGRGVDIALVYVPEAPKVVEQSLKSVGKGGKAVMVGICRENVQVDSESFLEKELQLRSSIEHSQWELLRVIELAKEKKIDLSKSITHKISLDEVNKGLEILEKKTGNPVRVVIVQ